MPSNPGCAFKAGLFKLSACSQPAIAACQRCQRYFCASHGQMQNNVYACKDCFASLRAPQNNIYDDDADLMRRERQNHSSSSSSSSDSQPFSSGTGGGFAGGGASGSWDESQPGQTNNASSPQSAGMPSGEALTAAALSEMTASNAAPASGVFAPEDYAAMEAARTNDQATGRDQKYDS